MKKNERIYRFFFVFPLYLPRKLLTDKLSLGTYYIYYQNGFYISFESKYLKTNSDMSTLFNVETRRYWAKLRSVKAEPDTIHSLCSIVLIRTAYFPTAFPQSFNKTEQNNVDNNQFNHIEYNYFWNLWLR